MVLRGMAYRRVDNRRKALVAYQAIHSSLGEVMFFTILPTYLSMIGHRKDRVLLQKSAHWPFNSSCWFNYALACLNVQDTKTVIRCFTMPIYRPHNDDAFCNYGLALVDNGSQEVRWESFICSLNTNIRILKHTNLGNVMMSKCEPESALLIYCAALVWPSTFKSWFMSPY